MRYIIIFLIENVLEVIDDESLKELKEYYLANDLVAKESIVQIYMQLNFLFVIYASISLKK